MVYTTDLKSVAFWLEGSSPSSPTNVMNWIDLLTYLAYMALVADMIIQSLRILRRRSSADISIAGTSIRGVAILIILYKLIRVNDVPILIGHLMTVVAFILYITLVALYQHKTGKK